LRLFGRLAQHDFGKTRLLILFIMSDYDIKISGIPKRVQAT
jgi:hypothetical protein